MNYPKKFIKAGTIPHSKIKFSKKYSKYSLTITQVEEELINNDILSNGQTEPIQLDENFNLLDGYLRVKLLKKLQIPLIKYEQWTFESEAEKIKHIFTLNRMRRHYTEYQKCQMALTFYDKEKKNAEKRQKLGKTIQPQDPKGEATKLAAKAAGTSGSTFKRFLEIIKSDELKKYEPDLIKGTKKIKTVSTLVTRKDRNLPKQPLPKTISDVFLVDVPYSYNDKGGKAAAEQHYDTMSIDEIIKDFKTISAADNAIMFFWMSPSIQYDTIPIQYTNKFSNNYTITVQIPIYKAILDAGKFTTIKGEFVWNKKKIGVGSWNRNQHENLLIAIKGTMPVPAELFSSIIEKLRSTHSKKPNIWPMLKKMYPKRNYTELYARVKTPGVLSHGNQIKEKSND